MNKFAKLSQKDLADLVKIISACTGCSSEKELTRILLSLQTLISFDCATVTYAHPMAFLSGNESAVKIFNYNYPPVLMERYFEYKQYNADIQLQAYSRTGELQNFNDAIRRYNGVAPSVVDLDCCEYGLTDGWTYGIGNLDSTQFALVNLFGGHIENDERTRIIVPLVIIHLCECYKRILKPPELTPHRLTPRETEVLNWLKEGKTSWETSIIFGISERSANFHINNLKIKLNAVNRIQAVAIALSRGIIRP